MSGHFNNICSTHKYEPSCHFVLFCNVRSALCNPIRRFNSSILCWQQPELSSVFSFAFKKSASRLATHPCSVSMYINPLELVGFFMYDEAELLHVQKFYVLPAGCIPVFFFFPRRKRKGDCFLYNRSVKPTARQIFLCGPRPHL